MFMYFIILFACLGSTPMYGLIFSFGNTLTQGFFHQYSHLTAYSHVCVTVFLTIV